jgi:hypothetical protein
MELDLNLQNYDIYDLLNIFHLEWNFQEKQLQQCKQKVNALHPSNTGKDTQMYYGIFSQVYKLLECVLEYRAYHTICNPNYYPMDKDHNILIKYILTVDNFMDKDNKTLIDGVSKKDDSQSIKDILTLLLKEKQHTNYDFFNFSNNVPNEIKHKSRYLYCHMSSIYRENYYKTQSSNYTYHMPETIKNVISLKLVSFETPNAWYNISRINKNNEMTIEMEVNGECSVFNIIIPDGNYSLESLENLLNETYFCNSKNENALQYISFDIDTTSLKSRFIVNSDQSMKVKMNIYFAQLGNKTTSLGWLLGFRVGSYLNIEQFVTSEGLFDMSLTPLIYLSINDYQFNNTGSHLICLQDTYSKDDNILAKINISTSNFAITTSNIGSYFLSNTRHYNGRVDIRKLEVKLLDSAGNVLDMNNMDYSFTLEFEVAYEK